MFLLQEEMGKKTREDLSYLSKRSYKTKTKTRISKCFRCNNYYTYPNNLVYCLSCQAENRRKEYERLTPLEKISIATFCYGWECQEEKNPSQTAPIPAESSVSSSGPLTE